MRAQIGLFGTIHKALASVCFAMLFLSCVGFKAIGPESTGGVSDALRYVTTGDIIVAMMKTRDQVKMEVTTVDSLKISGIHRFMNSKGDVMRVDTTLLVANIQSLKKRKFSVERTTLLVVSIAVGSLILYGLSSIPFSY
jgi:hypothetical protein